MNPNGGSKFVSLYGKYSMEPRDLFDSYHPFQRYSRHHWITHVQTQEGQETDPNLIRFLKIFLGSPSESSSQYWAWNGLIAADNLGYSTSVVRGTILGEISSENTTVFSMCRFSFYTLLLEWWDNAEIPLSQTNEAGQDLLTVAIIGGCKPICEALIKRGIQVNVPVRDTGSSKSWEIKYGSALIAAAARGETKIVNLLVEKGADLNMPLQSGSYGSALAAAVARGETKIIEFFVEKGADLNMPLPHGQYGSALAVAVAEGKTESIEFLVDKGADLNMPLQNGDYGSALAAAVAIQNLSMVSFLIRKGADVNMQLQSGKCGSALAAAAYLGRTALAKALIEAGAKVNLRLENGAFSTALQASRANVSQEDQMDRSWNVEFSKQRKAKVAELLQRYGATDEV